MNPRVRVFDTATKPVVLVDRCPDAGDFPTSELDGVVVLVFAGEVDVDPAQLAATRTARVTDTGDWRPIVQPSHTILQPPPGYTVTEDDTYRAGPAVGGGANL